MFRTNQDVSVLFEDLNVYGSGLVKSLTYTYPWVGVWVVGWMVGLMSRVR